MTAPNPDTRCGHVAIVGRPNVGKSTLLNYIIGKKISIVSPKPQTTRNQILAIKTLDKNQAIYIDTPGFHLIKQNKKIINRQLNKAALSSLRMVDLVVFLTQGLRFGEEEEILLEKIIKSGCPIIWAINKVDLVKPKNILLPFVEEIKARYAFNEIIPISAKNGFNINVLEKIIFSLLPFNRHFYPDDQLIDLDEKFIAQELIREKLILYLGQELPYANTVVVDQLVEKKGRQKLFKISATIFVEREGQKAIVIGKNGAQLKRIATAARLELEDFFREKVFLQLWVKVKKNWANDERALKEFGY